MSTTVSINLPVSDLAVSTDFFTALGFSVNPQFRGAPGMECLVISDCISVMLHTESGFQALSRKDHVDARQSAEVVLQLRVESRQRVDELVDKALAAGGRIHHEPNDQGFLYGRSFQDLDGHLWDVFWVDMPAA